MFTWSSYIGWGQVSLSQMTSVNRLKSIDLAELDLTHCVWSGVTSSTHVPAWGMTKQSPITEDLLTTRAVVSTCVLGGRSCMLDAGMSTLDIFVCSRVESPWGETGGSVRVSTLQAYVSTRDITCGSGLTSTGNEMPSIDSLTEVGEHSAAASSVGDKIPQREPL